MKNITHTFACAAALLALLGAPAHAQEVKAGDLVITQPWSRATPGGAKIAGGFLTIENKGTTPDRLVSGSGDYGSVASRVCGSLSSPTTGNPDDGADALQLVYWQ